jgi:outer membrane immunogenic protein
MNRNLFGIVALVTSVVVTFCGAPALAADMAVKAPPVAPVMAPAYNWTGFYLGGNVGAEWQSDPGTSNWFQALGVGAGLTNNPQANSLTSDSIIGGIQAGYNWQISQWILGVEGDWDWTHRNSGFCRQTDAGSAPCSDNGRGFVTLSSNSDWIATVRGRLGYAWDRYLIYGTGGAAFGRVETSINASCLVGGCGVSAFLLNTTGNFSDTKTGWAAGGGVEAMLTQNWLVRVEYLHIDFGTLNNTLNLVGTGGGAQSASWSRSERYDVVRTALSYKF